MKKIIIITLTALIAGGSYLYSNYIKNSDSTIATIKKNEKIFAQHNIELDPIKRIYARAKPGISLIDDHPEIRKQIDTHKFVKDTLSLGENYTLTLTKFRKALGNSVKKDATDQMVIKKMHEALNRNPTQEIAFKRAVKSSSNLGPKYLSSKNGLPPISYTLGMLQRIELRAFCEINLNLSFTESLESLKKTIQLTNSDGFGIASKLSAAFCNKRLQGLYRNALTAPNLPIKTITELLKYSISQEHIYIDCRCIEDEFADNRRFLTKGAAIPIDPINQELLMHLSNHFLYLRFDEKGNLNKSLNRQLIKESREKISEDIKHSHRAIKEVFEASYKTTYLNGLAQIRMEIDITRLLTAAKIHQLTHGQYPKTLAELTPSILPKLPTQPFNKNPYTYTPPKNQNHLPTITGQFKTNEETIKITTQDLFTPN